MLVVDSAEVACCSQSLELEDKAKDVERQACISQPHFLKRKEDEFAELVLNAQLKL